MLTDTAIRKAVPSQKTTRLFDGDGLYLEVSPRAVNGGGLNIVSRARRSAFRRACIPT
jgi:hypothetical protein